jgi:DNA-binding transcriptional LysR family regulator
MNYCDDYHLKERCMDLSDLRIFCAVVREGGVTRASERLHRVQSNVTTRVRKLEEDLGAPLFIRAGKRLHLAPAGQVLLGYADRLLAMAEEARLAVQDPRPRGLFRLGSMESTAAIRLPAPLSLYHRRHPEVNLELRTGNPQVLSAAVLAGEIDAAFVAEPIVKGPFEKVLAFQEELIIVSSLDHGPIDKPNQLPPAVVVFEHGCPHRKRLEAWYERRGGMPARTVQLGSYHAMLGCVVVGMGIALMPKGVLAGFAERRRLQVHQLPKGEDIAETVLIWRRGMGCPKIRALQSAINTTDPDIEMVESRRVRAKR